MKLKADSLADVNWTKDTPETGADSSSDGGSLQ